MPRRDQGLPSHPGGPYYFPKSGGVAGDHQHDASDVISGTFNDARLSSNVPRLNAVENNFLGALKQASVDVAKIHIAGIQPDETDEDPYGTIWVVSGDVVGGGGGEYSPVDHTHPASDITGGAFGAGNYTFPGTVSLADDLTLTKVGGNIVVGSNENVGVLRSGVLNGGVVVAGGNASNSGGNIIFRGPSHTDASHLVFRAGSTEVMRLIGGAAAITGTLGVSGAVALDSTLSVDGTLSADGVVTFADFLQMGSEATNGSRIFRTVSDDALYVSGGNASSSGGNLVLYGGSHGTLADTVLFRTGSTARLRVNTDGVEIPYPSASHTYYVGGVAISGSQPDDISNVAAQGALWVVV